MALCAGLCLLPLWAFDYLPMVDLPQHAAQIAIWLHWDDPAYGYPEHFVVNWATPYLLGNALVFLLAQWMPVLTAFKVLISAAILAIPLAAWLLVRRTGGDPWWLFVCLPVGFSFNFYWGFVNFMVATPLALLFIALAVSYASRPTVPRGFALFLLAHLLFVAHPLLIGLCGLIAATLVLLRAPSLRVAILRLTPLLGALPLIVLWLFRIHSTEAIAREPTIWAYGWHRLFQLVSLPVGLPPSPTSVGCVILFLTLPFLLGGRPARQAYRWVPVALVTVLFMAVPHKILGTSLLYERFSVLVLPTFLFALDRRESPGYPPWRQALAPLLAGAWILSLGLRFWGFHMEVGDLRLLIDDMPAQRRVLYFAPTPRSDFIPYPVFVYFGTWYQVERGGMVDFSFAEFHVPLFRYKPDSKPPLPPPFRWRPWLFRFNQHGGELYDYYLVRSPVDLGRRIFFGASQPILLERKRGHWWLYRRAPRDIVSSK